MISSLYSISEFWQRRCKRLTSNLPKGHTLRSLNQKLWKDFSEETRRILVRSPGGELLEVKFRSVLQGPELPNAFFTW
jgi:hypothetical protein